MVRLTLELLNLLFAVTLAAQWQMHREDEDGFGMWLAGTSCMLNALSIACALIRGATL